MNDAIVKEREKVENLIYEIRDVQVMLDSEISVTKCHGKVVNFDNKEYISLTDLARYANPEEPKIPIYAWM